MVIACVAQYRGMLVKQDVLPWRNKLFATTRLSELGRAGEKLHDYNRVLCDEYETLGSGCRWRRRLSVHLSTAMPVSGHDRWIARNA